MQVPNLNIGGPELWAKFGIEGLVIFALFISLIVTVVFMVKKFDNIDKRNTHTSIEIMKMHKAERDEWRQSSERQLDKFEDSINKLTQGLYETRNK